MESESGVCGQEVVFTAVLYGLLPFLSNVTMVANEIVDAYRNKMRSTMLAAGRETSSIPDHFETRAGKRRFLERGRQRTLGHADASRRNAEEVE